MNSILRQLGLLTVASLCAAATLLLVPAMPSHAQATPAPADHETEESCRKFVQSFYDWYLSTASRKNLDSPSMDTAIDRKPQFFSAELLRRLKEDSEAQAKTPGEIVGLDFDPFLNSQDSSPRFSAGRVLHKGASYWVDVHGLEARTGKHQEHVIPELIQQNGTWIFVNFHYGSNQFTKDSNLLSILKDLAADRQKPE
jgi:hypothetical protein